MNTDYRSRQTSHFLAIWTGSEASRNLFAIPGDFLPLTSAWASFSTAIGTCTTAWPFSRATPAANFTKVWLVDISRLPVRLLRGAEYRLMPIFLRVAEPGSVPGRLEPGELAHSDTVSVADGEEFPQFILAGRPPQVDHQTAASFTDVTVDAGDTPQPLEERALVVPMVEPDACVHVEQRQEIGGRHFQSLRRVLPTILEPIP
jgi:hypothetical protein